MSNPQSPNSIQELHTVLRLVTQRGIDVVIQEIIPGPVSSEFLLRGYFNRASQSMGLCVMQNVRSRPFSVSSAFISVPLTQVEEVSALIIDYLTTLQYHGPFMAELKRDARDGVLKLLEINARTGGGNTHALACGFNQILLAYREAIGESISPISRYMTNVYSTDMLSDILTVTMMLRQRQLDGSTLIRSYTQKRIDWLFWWNDLAPFFKQLQILFTTKILTRLTN
jgi:predicted ATP-grasp superfamily ATP-dependent carboligase